MRGLPHIGRLYHRGPPVLVPDPAGEGYCLRGRVPRGALPAWRRGAAWALAACTLAGTVLLPLPVEWRTMMVLAGLVGAAVCATGPRSLARRVEVDLRRREMRLGRGRVIPFDALERPLVRREPVRGHGLWLSLRQGGALPLVRGDSVAVLLPLHDRLARDLVPVPAPAPETAAATRAAAARFPQLMPPEPA